VNLRISFRSTTGLNSKSAYLIVDERATYWMNMVTAKVSTKIKCLMNRKICEILVSESNDLALSN
jgi:hypothetical protein